ncbi:bifunctional hydroxymethylpyrimidine kinase/phosphomethylpyrimidine kinase [Arthrobacter sp. ISL-85]|uniref:PfkB family carbohydrate kinase n=1 Tax=Arthrobacter sp. ISL-85 TaxID=2819115 RepID=UPI001BE950C8|nr:PfkB family carbohydrate kinase [Arthrobacter sp. ISL-85]MBT2566150.1 bifunctional hydroxymethylpyrimidine kinase/phosphomethylpyrimidine kinase [Arthrobacter sp. ISL-85]
MGEILVEVATDLPFAHGVPARLGISGDALNVAAAAAAAGASVGLLSVLTDDELGSAIAARIAELGISTDLLKFRRGQQGVYLVHSDPDGEREFSYARNGSVGSTLGPDDVDSEVFAAAGAVVAGGIACAISATSRAAVVKAASLAKRFVYDPNYRPRLTTAEAATAALTELAPHAFLVTPSFPGETSALLGVSSAGEAAAKLRSLGTAHVAVTCGAKGVQLESDGVSAWIPAIPAPAVVDQTGAGDAFVGTLTARLVLGDDFPTAARYGVAASSLVVGGKGGTGLIPTFQQTRAHAAAGSADVTEGAVPSNA